MTNQYTTLKPLNAALWTAQVLVAVCLIMGAVMKWMPVEKTAPLMPWMGELPLPAVRLLGLLDLLGAAGLILPAILRMNRRFIAWSAAGIVALMLSAIAFHLSRGEAEDIGFNVFLAGLAGFVAWGRFKK